MRKSRGVPNRRQHMCPCTGCCPPRPFRRACVPPRAARRRSPARQVSPPRARRCAPGAPKGGGAPSAPKAKLAPNAALDSYGPQFNPSLGGAAPRGAPRARVGARGALCGGVPISSVPFGADAAPPATHALPSGADGAGPHGRRPCGWRAWHHCPARAPLPLGCVTCFAVPFADNTLALPRGRQRARGRGAEAGARRRRRRACGGRRRRRRHLGSWL